MTSPATLASSWTPRTTPCAPVATRSVPGPPSPTPQVNAADLAYAAGEAVHQVLPAAWHSLPGGQEVAVLLANHYAHQQQPQAERLAPAIEEAEAVASSCSAGTIDGEEAHGLPRKLKDQRHCSESPRPASSWSPAAPSRWPQGSGPGFFGGAHTGPECRVARKAAA